MAVLLLIGLILFFWGCFFFHVLFKLKNMEAGIRTPLERELEHHVEELRQTKSVSNARELFLAALSHELRTPLSGVSGAVELLQETGLNPRQQEYARMIAYANATMLEVVDDMLTFSRIQAGKVQVERAPFSIKEIIDNMLSLQTMQAQARGIALIRDISPDVPDLVVGDRGKLNQILLNIIGNAIKFTDEGSVTVTVQEHNADDSDKVCLSFSVADTGIGIAADEFKDIFTPFTQGRDVHQNRRGGTGLGLAICQRLVQVLDGCIRLESVPGEGSRVTFTLGFDKAAEIVVPQPVSVSAQPSLPKRSMTVLVVEDDEINRLVCVRYLALEGHHPLVAADARQVMHIMQGVPYVPDVILMDMNLPGTTGVDLAMKIRENGDGRWKHVPVLIMSADVSGVTLERSLLGGMAGFLAKPFTAAQLSHALHSLAVPDYIGSSVTANPDPGMDPTAETYQSLLDLDYLDDEIEVLGVDILLELLNMFRATVATRISQMMYNAGKLNWEAVGDGAHQLQGSAGNLGMARVIRMARALHSHIRTASVLTPSQMTEMISELEGSCHVSSDALRQRLLVARDQNVALVADSDE